jgi:hypothetical protein
MPNRFCAAVPLNLWIVNNIDGFSQAAMFRSSKDSKIMTVTVFGANDAPNTEHDEVTVDISVNGVYFIDLLVNDIDGDALSIVGANTSLGSVSINGENLTLTTQTGFVW